MRALETVTLVLGLVGWLWSSQHRLWGQRLVHGAALLALVSHLFWEGLRWQMLPAYLVVIVGVMMALWSRPTRNAPTQRLRVLRWMGRGLGVLGLGAAALLCLLLPVYRLPAPTGPYGVGRVTYAQRIGLTGPVDGRHSVRLVNAYTSAFFDRYLKQVESPLLRMAVAAYPEVTFQARQPGQGTADTR